MVKQSGIPIGLTESGFPDHLYDGYKFQIENFYRYDDYKFQFVVRNISKNNFVTNILYDILVIIGNISDLQNIS